VEARSAAQAGGSRSSTVNELDPSKHGERELKFDVELEGKLRRVELAHAGEIARWTIDGRVIEADAVAISSGVYSILIDGKSFEVRVEPRGDGGLRVTTGGREFAATLRDPRQWKRYRGAGIAAEGRQQVTAPMPGKIVRVLARTGDSVDAGQGILVVEAMKMQNEIRSPKSGTLERLLVVEGQTVNAGEVVATVA
jgi:biotin carboxyl carrier protein